MRFLGATHKFLGDVLPSDFRAEIFSLVENAWPNVPSPRDAWLEPRITGLLKLAMIAAQEARYEADPPFHISEDTKIRDPKTGKEKERTDAEIHLRHHYIKGQRPYFVFESKRLNVPYGGVPSPNVHEYVGDGGMGCLLAGGYNTVPNYSGMLAFVMDGNIATAKRAVEKQLARRSEELCLRGEAKFQASALMAKGSPHGETHHTSGGRTSIIFHIFLPAVRAQR
ncbi:MAG: hypothetical protein IH623_18895 [Verrucomicrobia bacterium]|nr:hypothetical protein [Verrucomicrobiota bacterium]